MIEFEVIQKAYQCQSKEEGIRFYKGLWFEYISNMSLPQIKMECVSLINRHQRQSLKLDLDLKIGDVCYIDYGPMYRYEAGYQHFGIILKLSHYKAFVVPLTSNIQPHHCDKDHVFKLGSIQGLTKHSICFLNDAKFINTSRIIDVYGHLCISDERFIQLRRKVFETIFG
jgi:hypothetical protein